MVWFKLWALDVAARFVLPGDDCRNPTLRLLATIHLKLAASLYCRRAPTNELRVVSI